MRIEALVTKAAPHVGRLLSTIGGVLILRHEVYVAEEAEAVLVALGLWLIGIPPALWLDTVRRTTDSLSGRKAPEDESGSETRRRGDEA